MPSCTKTPKKTVLILGADGQLGYAIHQAIRQQFSSSEGCFFVPAHYHCVTIKGPSAGGLDFINTEQLRECLIRYRPELIINVAAYTAVDRAEIEPERAFLINAQAVSLIAQLQASWQGKLIHFSTDYVFNPENISPSALAKQHQGQDEQSLTNPINNYGHSKLAGEQAILASGVESLIIRTSWLYSVHKQNFLHSMICLMQEHEQIQVVADQWGVPTSVDFVQDLTFKLWQRGARGIFHVVPDGVCTWFEYAQEIAQHLTRLNIKIKLKEINPQTYEQYRAKTSSVLARRPQYAILSNDKLKKLIGQALPSWQENLAQVIERAYIKHSE